MVSRRLLCTPTNQGPPGPQEYVVEGIIHCEADMTRDFVEEMRGHQRSGENFPIQDHSWRNQR